MKASEFDEKFEAGEDVTACLDPASARRAALETRRLGGVDLASRVAADVLLACESALALAPAEWPPTLPVSPLHKAPEWYPFEHEAWALGESVRQAFSKMPSLKRDRRVQDAVLQVATCRNLRRGRQSFVMVLGFVDARDLAPALAPFLDDPDVDGHVVDALLGMKAPGFAPFVRPLLDSKRAWIRKLARRYAERYP